MNLKDFNFKPLYTIDKSWGLLTSGDKNKFNMMTVSWGGMGTLWSKPVVTVYVRNSRYTNEFLKENNYFTLSFYDEEYKKDLSILGSKSGRDIDKLSLTKLTPDYLDLSVSFKEANLTLVCKKIYVQKLDIKNMPNEVINTYYKDNDMHYMYVGEVIDIIDKRNKNKD